MRDLLSQFCANETDPRAYLHAPFSYGQYSYASNGNIIIRIPRCKEIPECEDPSVPRRLDELLSNLKLCDDDFASLLGVPEFEMEECPYCDAKGRSAVVVCPECNGKGSLVISNHYSDYHVDCKTCDGQCEIIKAGGTTDCGECGGSKNIKSDPFQKYSIGDITISLSVAIQLSSLPEVKINIPDMPGHLLGFRFDCGEGIVICAQ